MSTDPSHAAAFVRSEQRDGVALLTIDNPPVNALSEGMRRDLYAGVRAAEADPATKAVVITCPGRTFVAGADIAEFDKPMQPPTLHDIIDVIERGTKPVVAAMHGTALGGGLELALACNYRLAVTSTRFGLPEVTLGIIPGGGGTQRLPRLVGVEKALQMITSGSMIGASEALQIGLLDEIVEGDLVD